MKHNFSMVDKVNENTSNFVMYEIFFFGCIFFLQFLTMAQDADSLLEQYRSYPNDTTKVNLLYNKGFAFRKTDLISAGKFSQACYSAAVLAKNHKCLVKALNFRGVLKAQTGFNKEATIDFERALLLSIQTKDSLSQIVALNNLGNVYSELNEDYKALACYESSLNLAKIIENDYWIKGDLLGIAGMQLKMKLYAPAEGNFKTILNMCDFTREQEIISICDLNLGLCKLYNGDIFAAEAYQLQALDEMQMMEDTLGECDAYANLAEIYLAKRELKGCFSYLKKALTIAQQNNYNEGLLKTWKVLSAYFKEIKKSDEALYYLSKHDSALSVNKNSVDSNLAGIWNKNDVESLKAEASVLTNNFFLGGIIIGMLILFLAWIFKSKGDEQKE